MTDLTHRLGDRPVVAVLRSDRSDRFVSVCRTVVEAGIPAVEITLTTPGAIEAIRRIRAELPHAVVGAGTVRTAEQLHDAIDAGALFLVSQITSPSLVEAAAARGVAFIPGALTPNEIVRAWELGVEAVKVSPIGPVGGLEYLSELVGPLPEVPLFPTGGVLLDEAAAYLCRGAALIGVSRDLLRDAFDDGGDLDALGIRAETLISAVDRRSSTGLVVTPSVPSSPAPLENSESRTA